MLTCITCSKQRKEEEEDGEDGVRGSGNGNGIPSSNKEAVKSLSTQFKDIALKVSGNSKQSKPNTPGGSFRRGGGHNPDFDAISEAVSYAYNTPRTGKTDSRFTGPFGGGNRIPTGLESVTGQSGEVVMVENEDEPKEWIAQVEPGVQVTFLSLASGGNDLKRIRFSRDLFNKWEAQRWWGENYDRIMELYNVQRFNRQALNTPSRSEDQRDSTYSRLGSVTESPMMTPSMNKDWGPRNFNRPSNGNNYKNYFPNDPLEQGSGQQYNGGGSNASYYAHGGGGGGGQKGENIPSMDAASRTTTSSRDEASVSISNASDIDCEWIEQDEPGIYITIRQLADGTRELRRVRFSREKFGEVHAKLWWEANRDRIQAQYL